MQPNYYALILAGGGGTRLWPMSRQARPKQLLSLIEERTMLQISVERILPTFGAENIVIVTGAQYIEQMREQVPQIPAENFVVEPYGRDSGPAAALGIAVIHQRNPSAIVAQLNVDHYIGLEEKFRDLLEAARTVAEEGYIVTLGIAPSYPATGFGYIRQGDSIQEANGFTVYHTRGFTEKPNEITATGFVASGQYSWNSGMFIWSAARAMEEFEHQQPQIYDLIEQIQSYADQPDFDEHLQTIWDQMPKISIDYAVMESAKQMAVIPADIGWNDVGTWDSLFEVHKLDKFGNLFRGEKEERVILDTANTMVLSDRLIVTIGVENLIVVDTGDVLFICDKNRSQDVRDVVKHLRSIKHDDYL
jgi:mannose-1-phosphate guanylyltransferase